MQTYLFPRYTKLSEKINIILTKIGISEFRNKCGLQIFCSEYLETIKCWNEKLSLINTFECLQGEKGKRYGFNILACLMKWIRLKHENSKKISSNWILNLRWMKIHGASGLEHSGSQMSRTHRWGFLMVSSMMDSGFSLATVAFPEPTSDEWACFCSPSQKCLDWGDEPFSGLHWSQSLGPQCLEQFPFSVLVFGTF